MYTYIFCTFSAYYLLIMIDRYVNNKINKFIHNDNKYCSTSQIITDKLSQQTIPEKEYCKKSRSTNKQKETDKEKEAKIQKSLSMIVDDEQENKTWRSKSKDKINNKKMTVRDRSKSRSKSKKNSHDEHKQKCTNKHIEPDLSQKKISKPVLVLKHSKTNTKSDTKSHSKPHKIVKDEPHKVQVHKKKSYEYEQCDNSDNSDDYNNREYSIHLNNAKKNKITIKKIYNYYCAPNDQNKNNKPQKSDPHIDPSPNPCPRPEPNPDPKTEDCGCDTNKLPICDIQHSNIYQITDCHAPTYIRFKEATKISYTLVGGGGAGGIGFCVKTLFFNGGGGCAADTKQGIIDVKKCDIWKITIGKGGCSKVCLNGQQSMIECFTNGIKTQCITVNGGHNGYPCIQQVYALTQGQSWDHNALANIMGNISTNGTNNTNSYDLSVVDIKNVDFSSPDNLNQLVLGGKSNPCDLVCSHTQNGENGSVVTISCKRGTPGNGGFTQNTSACGTKGNVDNIMGTSGSHGSGGGGGLCWDFDPSVSHYSSDGGSGYLIIQCIPGIDTKNTNITCLMDVSKNSF